MGPSEASKRVAIIADDHELFRVALSSILKTRLGFAKVVETTSLGHALKRLDDTRATLALFDLNMPGMDTASSLLAVRRCFPDVLVTVVSGSTARRDILLALEAGVHGYVPKTLGIDEITSALRMVLEGGIYVPPSLALVGSTAEPPAPRTLGPAPEGNANRASASLTYRQGEVLALLTQGKSNKEISRELGLGEGTVKVHMAALFRALGVSSRAAAAAVGARKGRAALPNGADSAP